MIILISKNDYDVLVRYRTGAVPLVAADISDRESALARAGLIEVSSVGYEENQIGFPTAYRITPAGLDALCSFEQKLQEDAAAKRQQRFQNQISVASVLVPLITFILGLLMEHFCGVLEFLMSIIH